MIYNYLIAIARGSTEHMPQQSMQVCKGGG